MLWFLHALGSQFGRLPLRDYGNCESRVRHLSDSLFSDSSIIIQPYQVAFHHQEKSESYKIFPRPFSEYYSDRPEKLIRIRWYYMYSHRIDTIRNRGYAISLVIKLFEKKLSVEFRTQVLGPTGGSRLWQSVMVVKKGFMKIWKRGAGIFSNCYIPKVQIWKC